MAEYPFFYKVYKACSDHQIYRINCKEVSIEIARNHDYSIQSDKLHVFYFQQPENKKIYQVTCEMYFSREHKENLESHLKRDLIGYLAPIQISDGIGGFDTGLINTNQQQYIADNNTFNQLS